MFGISEPYNLIYMTNTIILFLEVGIVLLSGYLIFYVHQKGKNQADKEDLKKLTEIVEDVKKKNTEEIEVIKANLSLLTDKGKQIFSEEKDSIVVFFAQLNTWIWDSLNINIEDYSWVNVEDIEKRLVEMQNAYNKTNVAYSKVMLIVSDVELVKTGQEAINKTYEHHIFREEILNRLCSNLEIQRIINEELQKVNYDVEVEQSSEFYQYLEGSRKKDKEKEEILDEYKAKNTEIFNSAMESVINFKNSAQNYLRKESSTNKTRNQ